MNRGTQKWRRRERDWRHGWRDCDRMCDMHSWRRDRLRSRAVGKRNERWIIDEQREG